MFVLKSNKNSKINRKDIMFAMRLPKSVNSKLETLMADAGNQSKSDVVLQMIVYCLKDVFDNIDDIEVNYE